MFKKSKKSKKQQKTLGFRRPSKFSHLHVLAFIFSGVVGLAAGYLIFAASNPIPLPVYPSPTLAYSYDQPDYYGVNVPFSVFPDLAGSKRDANTTQLNAQIKSTGVKWVRSDVTPKLASAFFNNNLCGGTTICSYNRLPGYSVLGIIDHLTMQTVSGNSGLCPAYSFSFGPGSANFTLSDWQKAVDCVSKLFKGNVNAYEIWNEPTLKNFQIPYSYQDGSASHYFDMLKIAYQTIKKNDPSATVIGLGGLVVYSGSDTTRLATEKDFAAQLAGLGAGQYMDAISLHPYPWGDYNSSVWDAYIANWNYYATLFNKPVWVTETGQDTNSGNQSAYLSYAYSLFINQKASRVFWYILKDASDGPFGLYDANNNSRPSASYMSYFVTTPKSGLLRVQTNPAAQVTINVKPTANSSASAYTAQWGIAWPRFEKGTYTISFTYPSTTFNGQAVKLPPPQTIEVKAKMTTVITVDITTGGFTTQYYWE